MNAKEMFFFVWIMLMLFDLDKRVKARKLTVSIWYAALWQVVAMAWAAFALIFS